MSTLAARLKYRILRSPAAALVKSARRLVTSRMLAARRVIAERLPVGEAADQAAIQLRLDGYARLDDLIDPELLARLARAALDRIREAASADLPKGVSMKAFWTRPLDADLVDGKIPADTAFTRFALDPQLLAFLSQSFGTLPLLDYVLLTISRPEATETGTPPPEQSQLWHRDHDDVRVIKVFVYLTDVRSRADGPFTFVPGRKSDAIGKPLRSHAPDQWLFARADPSDLVEMIAPALSVFAVETSRCLHMGSRVAPGHERALFTATYTTAPPIFGNASRFLDAAGESELVRAVLGQEHI